MSGGNTRHYLDWAATAIPDYPAPAVPFGNPSSLHLEGRTAREALENARKSCADVLGVEKETLYFTSGGTESNTLILHSFLLRLLSPVNKKSQLLFSAVEHPSIRNNILLLEKLGIPVGTIGAEKSGHISEENFSKALEKYPHTRFAAIMGINNETGSIMELDKLVSLARKKEKENGLPIHIHADLVQALGKHDLDIKGWDLDSASFSSHKLGGKKGTGLLYIKKPMESLSRGGDQEGAYRPGTENTEGIICFADLMKKKAQPDYIKKEINKAREHLSYLIEQLGNIKLRSGEKVCTIIPDDRERDDIRFSPWILQAGFKGIPGEVMVRALDKEGIAVSTGSACSVSNKERPVLAAMGLDEKRQQEGIRISQGWTTEINDMDALLTGIEKVLSYL